MPIIYDLRLRLTTIRLGDERASDSGTLRRWSRRSLVLRATGLVDSVLFLRRSSSSWDSSEIVRGVPQQAASAISISASTTPSSKCCSWPRKWSGRGAVFATQPGIWIQPDTSSARQRAAPPNLGVSVARSAWIYLEDLEEAQRHFELIKDPYD